MDTFWPLMPPKESTARLRCDAGAGWKLAGRLQSWAGADHPVPSKVESIPRAKHVLVLPRPRPITGPHPLRPGENLLLPSAPSSATGRLLLEPACRS
jgi:hypothetical protein